VFNINCSFATLFKDTDNIFSETHGSFLTSLLPKLSQHISWRAHKGYAKQIMNIVKYWGSQHKPVESIPQ
jgi:hypothetical protein